MGEPLTPLVFGLLMVVTGALRMADRLPCSDRVGLRLRAVMRNDRTCRMVYQSSRPRCGCCRLCDCSAANPGQTRAHVVDDDLKHRGVDGPAGCGPLEPLPIFTAGPTESH